MRKWINFGQPYAIFPRKTIHENIRNYWRHAKFYREEIETFSEISEKKNRESETGLSNTKFIKLLVFCCLIKWLPVSQEIRWFWPWNSDLLPKVTLEFFKNLSLNLRYILHKSINLSVSEYLSWRDRKKDTGPDGWAWKHCGDKPNTIGKFNSFSRLPNENFGP